MGIHGLGSCSKEQRAPIRERDKATDDGIGAPAPAGTKKKKLTPKKTTQKKVAHDVAIDQEDSPEATG